MFTSLYDPWDAVSLGFLAAVVLLVMGGVALRKTHGEIISRYKYFGYAACCWVAAIVLVVVAANLYVVSTPPFPAAAFGFVASAAVLTLTALFTVGYSLTRAHNPAWMAASVVWLGVTVTILSEVGYYHYFDYGWLPAASVGWYLTLAATASLIVVLAWQWVIRYGTKQRELGAKHALETASAEALSHQLMSRQPSAG